MGSLKWKKLVADNEVAKGWKMPHEILGFKGCCPFNMYLPSKPSKYGIKIIMVPDVSSKYLFNAVP